MSSSDRTLLNAFREINGMADRINLPKTIVDRANTLFKQVHDGKNLKGRANDAIASACLYIACRQEGVPRTFKEICAVSKISKKEIGRCFKLILKALETSVDLITTGDFMSRFCSNLGLPNMVQRAATHIARKAVEIDIVPGRSPISVAAAAIYMASQVCKTMVTLHSIIKQALFYFHAFLSYIGIGRQEITEGDWRHCWCCRCHNSTIVQIDVPTCKPALPGRFPICHTNRSVTTNVKPRKSFTFFFRNIFDRFKEIFVFYHKHNRTHIIQYFIFINRVHS